MLLNGMYWGYHKITSHFLSHNYIFAYRVTDFPGSYIVFLQEGQADTELMAILDRQVLTGVTELEENSVNPVLLEAWELLEML